MRSKPQISIIVPFYNEEKYLADCIKSILAQSFDNFELILVNDGSTDNSKAICLSFIENDQRIKLINLNNGGVTLARKKGWERSSGEWITFADGDDLLKPDALEILYQTAIQSDSEIIKGAFERFPLNDQIKNNISGILQTENYLEALVRGNVRGVLYAALYNRRLFSADSFNFDSTLKVGEDILTSFEIGKKACSVLSINNILYRYRTNNHSILKQNIVHPKYFMRLFDRMKEIVPNDNSELENNLWKLIEEKKYQTSCKSFFSPNIQYDSEVYRYLVRVRIKPPIKSRHILLLKSKQATKVFKWVIYNLNLLRIKLSGKHSVEYNIIY